MNSATVIAATGDRFVDLCPYVASIDADGTVAFTSALAGGGTGVFTGRGGQATSLGLETDARISAVTSHPAIAADVGASVYATLSGGGQAVVVTRGGKARIAARAPGDFASIGPLGPTMNGGGAIAFRATTHDGRAAMLVGDGAGVSTIAEADAGDAGFHGLPCVTDAGALVYHIAKRDETGRICIGGPGGAEVVAQVGTRFVALGRFPCATFRGGVAFVATEASAEQGAYVWSTGETTTVAHTRDGFVSFRGVLVDGAGRPVFYATPVGGTLGIYTGRDPGRHRLLGIGDELWGRRISEFALNPVSINRAGQLAVRLLFDGGEQMIVRVDT